MNSSSHRPIHKSRFYLRHYLSRLVPSVIHRRRLSETLDRICASLTAEERKRVNHYNKLSESFRLTDSTNWASFHHKRKSTYKIDFHGILKHFDQDLPFHYYFGDEYRVTPEPQFIKARPLDMDNVNSVIMRFGSMRHYYFPADPVPHSEKKNVAIWRGTVANNRFREILVDRHCDTPRCDVKGTNRRTKSYEGSVPKISIAEQLKNKFLISIEGNDVATNTKWIMNSNSLCFMPRPRRESWFMEGELIPGEHYVQLADDFADLKEKIDYYSKNSEEAAQVVKNAQDYCRQFQDLKREEEIGLVVAAKYFHLCEDADFSHSAVLSV